MQLLREILVHDGNIHQVPFPDDTASNERVKKKKKTGALL